MLKPDYDLLVPSPMNDPRANTVHAPDLYVFQKDEKKLLYINALHGAGDENPTIPVIARAFETHEIDAVVIEWPESSLPYPFAPIPRPFGCEASAAAHYAQEKHVPLYGGEPERSHVSDALLQKEYSLQDIQAYWFLLGAPRLISTGRITPSYPGNPAHIAYALDSFRFTARTMGLPSSAAMRFDDYRSWMNRHYPDMKNMWDVPAATTFPANAPQATMGQKMAYDHLCIRDPRIVRTIADAINAHPTVLVVYGANHFLAHRPVFEKMLGPTLPTPKGCA